ncbi:MAG: zinc-dependent metalloprotease [Planctomycetota bacterium]
MLNAMTRGATVAVAALILISPLAAQTPAKPEAPPAAKAEAKPEAPAKKPEFPEWKKVVEGYQKVVSTTGDKELLGVWTEMKEGKILAELPKDYEKKKFFFALTVSSGEIFAGLQSGDVYVYWRRYGKRLALVVPELDRRSTGERESKASVGSIFTDRVLVDVPIVSIGPRGGPMIDLRELLVGHAGAFFRRSAGGVNSKLVAIKSAKSFPENAEIAFEAPIAGGLLKTFHYSISTIPEKTGYEPRLADERVGFFTTSFQDLGQYKDDKTWTRYINRWHLEKADPKLKVSPPKDPIVFYIDHTTPIRYRRFVRDGVLFWNKAFENIGIVDAIEVRYQDEATGAHMDKDPEDVRYNFVRWLNNDVSTAIGPSRVDPNTGQILDADIVLTDGWIRAFEEQFSKLLPKLAMDGMGPDTLAWLRDNPTWDPRLIFAEEHDRRAMLAEREHAHHEPLGGHAMGNVHTEMLGDDEWDGLVGRSSQVNGHCMAAEGRALDMALLRMTLAMAAESFPADADDDTLDGMPARFIGPLLADLVAHEVGHTLGLRHNFKASSVYSYASINSKEFAGKKPFTTSVMDYNPINIKMSRGEVQGDYQMIDVGPYDMWAIEYGYTSEKDLTKILARSTEPELTYGTDEDTSGPDPFARRYDFAADPISYAREQMELITHHRQHLLDRFVRDGDSWAKARRGYDMSLSLQTRAIAMMANWIGGAHVNRVKKGSAGGGEPIAPVPAARQREALQFVMESTFRDEAYGLEPALLRHLTVDKWMDEGGMADARQDATYPVHDRVMALQGAAMTMILNPTTLRRVLDNESYVPADQDALTLPELLERIRGEVWRELAKAPEGRFTNRKPLVSNLRRNLQRVHVDRLIDLSLLANTNQASDKVISSLATAELVAIREALARGTGAGVDAYTLAHAADCSARIARALEARMIAK